MSQGKDREARVQEALDWITEVVRSPRVRDDYIDNILAMKERGHGTFVTRIPRAHGKPIDGMLITGALALRISEERDL